METWLYKLLKGYSAQLPTPQTDYLLRLPEFPLPLGRPED